MKKSAVILALTLLISVLFSIGFAENTEGLKPGDSGDEVLELNTRLRQLNYTATRANDQYGAATEAAVKAVQAAYGLQETGIADPPRSGEESKAP